MRKRLTLAATVLTLSLAALALIVLPRMALASPTMRFVGTSIGTDASCASPGYTSIQAAVNAANVGDTVYLCASGSPYAEAVDIHTYNLTLTGDSGATIQPPATWPASPALPAQFAADNLVTPHALVFIWGASVTVTGLKIQGPFASTGCGEQNFGILVLAQGNATISGDKVLNIRDANALLLGCQHGVGIQVGRRFWPTNPGGFATEDFVGHATITGSTVSGYQKNGITIDGPNSQASVSGTTIIGDGPVNYIAQNGSQVSRGATATFSGDTISANAYIPVTDEATAVLLYSGATDPATTGVHVNGSLITGNQAGIVLAEDSDIAFSAAVLTAQQNCIYSNSLFGAENDTASPTLAPFTAEQNWWGAASGPKNATSNPSGTGDTVTDNVDFAHWLTAPAPICGGPVVTNVKPTPNPAAPGAAVTLTATVSDASTSGNTIASAQYSLDGGSFQPMSASDGSFDQVTENVTAHLGAFSSTGTHNVCVRGTDAAGHTGAAVCAPFTVAATPPPNNNGLGGIGAPPQVQTAHQPSAGNGGGSAAGSSASAPKTNATDVGDRAANSANPDGSHGRDASFPVGLLLLLIGSIVLLGGAGGAALALIRHRGVARP